MSFLNPHFLWGLLLAIPLLAAYLLKVKPSNKQTNAWFLWQKVLEEKQTSALFSKLRSFLSLLLMLLALIFVCIGLAEPKFSEKDDRDIVIIIDNSASMQALQGDDSSLNLAKKEAHKIVQSLSSGQRASISTYNHTINYLSHLSSNTKSLHQIIDDIKPTSLPDTPSAGQTLERMAISQKNSNSNTPDSGNSRDKPTRLIFISDGCHGEHFDKENTEIDHITVGSADDEEYKIQNIGIIAADIQPVIGQSHATALIQLVNAGSDSRKVELECYHPATEKIAELIELEVKPGKNDPVFIELNDAEPGEWIFRLLTEDALVIDNSAHLILRSLPAVSVSIPEAESYFYQRCVESFSKTTGALQLVSSDSEGPSQLQIFEGAIPDSAMQESGDILVFNPTGESPFWQDLGDTFQVALPLKERPDHPMLKHLDFSSMLFSGAKALTAPIDASILAKAENNTPLIYQVYAKSPQAKKSIIVVNLDPASNDFFLRTSFVVLTYNAAMYLSDNHQRLPAVFPLTSHQLYTALDKHTQTTPSGVEQAWEAGENVTTSELGYHRASTPELSIATSLLSLQESQLIRSVRDKKDLEVSAGYPLSFWLITLGVILLILESLFYHRRKAD